MIRSIIISALFFFGPALLMFMLRNMFLMLKIWLKARNQKAVQEAEVIDITPEKPSSPSTLFVTAAIIVGVVCAVLAWQEMTAPADDQRTYIPAHTDSQGKIIPGQYIPTPKN
ncbi:MAG: hypothetical protein R8K22_01815 [Mariprofundaceae bacterium]